MKKRMIAPLLALALAGTLTLLAGLGALKTPDLAASDALYQRRSDSEGKILLVGIDQKALEEFGPYAQWGRDVITRAIDALNAAEDCRPAVIGLDVLYTGETDPELDELLAQAAGRYGNVITACAAQFGKGMVPDEGDDQVGYRMDNVLLSLDRPYEALARAAGQGHINAMLDTDGILRHHLLEISLGDGSTIPSLALAAAERYRAQRGEEPVRRPPTDARGFWYVPFCGTPGDFECVSVADIAAGEFDAARFAGKLCSSDRMRRAFRTAI